MKHPFLFEAASWRAQGTFWNEAGVPAPAAARTVVTHLPGLWRMEGVVSVQGATPAEFRNAYEFDPPLGEVFQVRWRSFNQAMGAFTGPLVPVEDTLISEGEMAAAGIRVIEVLRLRERDTYDACGAPFTSGRRTASWVFRLARE